MTSVRSLRALCAGALLALSGCFPHPAPSPSPNPAASVAVISTAPVYVAAKKATLPPARVRSKTQVAKVQQTAQPFSTVTPSHVIPSVAPARAARAPLPKMPPSNLPRILAINISEVDIHSGDTMSGLIRTTPNVKTVEIRIQGWSMPIPKTHAGYFAMSGVIPELPFFVKGNYTLQVIARNATGLYTERDIPITLR